MKVYSMVRLFDGLITDMKIFTSYSEMKNYCDEVAASEDAFYQSTSVYPDINSEYVYMSNNVEEERHLLEIIVWPIEVKGIRLEGNTNGNS